MAGAFTHNGNVVEGLPSIASQINYDNTSSGMAATQVQSAIDELNTNKQPKTDNNLTTTDKTTTGAINELKSGLTNKQDTLLQTGLFNTATGSIETGITMQKFISAYSANWDNAYCYVRRKSDNTAIIDVKDGSGNVITNTNMAVIVNYLP